MNALTEELARARAEAEQKLESELQRVRSEAEQLLVTQLKEAEAGCSDCELGTNQERFPGKKRSRVVGP